MKKITDITINDNIVIDNIVVLSHTDITNYLHINYKYCYCENDFSDLFSQSLEIYKNEIKMIYDNLNLEYNVLNNVDAYEEKINSVNNTNIANTSSGNSTNKENSFENATLTDTNSTTTTATTTTTTLETFTENNKDNNTLTGKNTTHEIYIRRGNIGITKATELIMSNIDMRLKKGLLQFLDFIICEIGVWYNNDIG